MGQLLSVPLSYTASAAAGAGLGVVAALDDAIFGLMLDLTPAAAVFSRRYNRLASAAGPVEATYFLVPAGADWRGLSPLRARVRERWRRRSAPAAGAARRPRRPLPPSPPGWASTPV